MPFGHIATLRLHIYSERAKDFYSLGKQLSRLPISHIYTPPSLIFLQGFFRRLSLTPAIAPPTLYQFLHIHSDERWICESAGCSVLSTCPVSVRVFLFLSSLEKPSPPVPLVTKGAAWGGCQSIMNPQKITKNMFLFKDILHRLSN